MHNDRVPRGPLLGRKDTRHRICIERIRSQPVDGLGGKRHQPASAQDRCGTLQCFLSLRGLQMRRVHYQSQSLHISIVASTTGVLPAAVYSLFTMPIETEIKFRVDDVAGLTQRLEGAGFSLQTPRAFESNILYDTPDRAMRARTEILRIRGYAGRWTVTHKRLPDVGPGEDTHKHRVETETEVADGEALAQVFLSLGLIPAFRYEKWRAEWTDGEGHCVVDETPIGNYAELEGSPEWIDRAAARLGVEPAQYIILSYGRLFEQWREQRHADVQDLTFEAIEAAVSF